MKLYYISVCLSFLLNSHKSRSEPIPLESSSTKVPVCITEKCRSAAEMLRRNIADWRHPCDDFYTFACGRFFNGELSEQIFVRMLELNIKIHGYLNSDEDSNIQAIAKIQHIYRLCMNEDAIEKFGDKVIQLQFKNVELPSMPPFNPVADIPKNFSRILAKLHRDIGIPLLFSIDVKKDPKDYRINRLFIQLDSFTIQYIATRYLHFEINGQNRYKYFKNYMMGVVKYMYYIEGMDIPIKFTELVSDRIDDVIQFLLRADKVAQEHMYNISNYEYITIQKLQKKTDKILHNTKIKFDWHEYFLQLFKNIFDNVGDYFGSGEPLIIHNMKYIESIFEIISSVDAEVFYASLWWITLDDVSNISYEKLRILQNKFMKKAFGFVANRKNMCLTFVQDRYSHALTYLLLQEVNVESAKYELHEMKDNLKNSFIELIEKASWMDESTREEAVKKLNNMRTFISHEKWIEKLQKIEEKYAGVTVEYSWYETRLKENVRTVEEKLKLLSVTNKKNKAEIRWNPLAVGSMFNYRENTAVIPFGMLGLPFFNHGLHSMDYGGIGFVLGYTFTMAFDKTGGTIDSRGIERNWWQEISLREFNKRAKCLIDFYSKFNFNGREIELDGYSTLNSNIADNVGMELALSAYAKYVNHNEAEMKLISFDIFSSEQLLTLAMTSTMCSNTPPDSYNQQFVHDIHSVPQLRVNGIFMNSKKMADIWECPEGSPMNPKNKCPIW